MFNKKYKNMNRNINIKFKIEVIFEERGKWVYVLDRFFYLYIQIYLIYFDCYIEFYSYSYV